MTRLKKELAKRYITYEANSIDRTYSRLLCINNNLIVIAKILNYEECNSYSSQEFEIYDRNYELIGSQLISKQFDKFVELKSFAIVEPELPEGIYCININ